MYTGWVWQRKQSFRQWAYYAPYINSLVLFCWVNNNKQPQQQLLWLLQKYSTNLFCVISAVYSGYWMEGHTIFEVVEDSFIHKGYIILKCRCCGGALIKEVYLSKSTNHTPTFAVEQQGELITYSNLLHLNRS